MKFCLSLFLLIISFSLLLTQCKDDETENTGPAISINIKAIKDSKAIEANIFINDSLYGSCDKNGNFNIEKLDTGNYILICSAKYFRDTTLPITIKENKPLNFSFHLAVDSTIGRIYGEFEDMQLYQASITQNPDIENWNEKNKFDAVTGATLFYKNFTDSLPPRLIIMDQDTLAHADGFGQYWFKIQSGTYQIEGVCNGYKRSKKTITVLPNSKNYLNFYLERKQ